MLADSDGGVLGHKLHGAWGVAIEEGTKPWWQSSMNASEVANGGGGDDTHVEHPAGDEAADATVGHVVEMFAAKKSLSPAYPGLANGYLLSTNDCLRDLLSFIT